MKVSGTLTLTERLPSPWGCVHSEYLITPLIRTGSQLNPPLPHLILTSLSHSQHLVLKFLSHLRLTLASLSQSQFLGRFRFLSHAQPPDLHLILRLTQQLPVLSLIP